MSVTIILLSLKSRCHNNVSLMFGIEQNQKLSCSQSVSVLALNVGFMDLSFNGSSRAVIKTTLVKCLFSSKFKPLVIFDPTLIKTNI
jgi:hypothetical protein